MKGVNVNEAPASLSAIESVATEAQMPRLVAAAAGTNSVLARVLERWAAARRRLGLSRCAERIGAVVLASEFDVPVHATVAQGSGAPSRADIVNALDGEIEAALVAVGLNELGQRRVIVSGGSAASCWIREELRIAEEVCAYLVGTARADEADHAEDWQLASANVGNLEAELSPRTARLIEAIARQVREGHGARLLVVVRGPWGSGRDSAVARLLDSCGAPALCRTTRALASAQESLEPELSGAATVWDVRRDDPSPRDYELAEQWLDRSPTLAIALLDRSQDAPQVGARRVVTIDVAHRDLEERTGAWRATLTTVAGEADWLDHAAFLLAERSRAGAGLAARAAHMILHRTDGARFREASELVLELERALDELARPSMQRGTIVERPDTPLSRLIVSEAVATTLGQLLTLAETRTRVESQRVGVKALFAGPSGTGKTLAARAIASHLDLPLYRVDLAGVVSKWVGETEKNLRHVLESAESAGAVLLFDEGDALLAKRGEVTRGADRYANVEVSYLLQAIEAHDGIVIVTTNQKQNIDSAFQRRFDVSIEFVRPSPEARALLWKQELGSAAGKTLDRSVLKKLSTPELSGGNIAAAARLACALAHQRGEDVVTSRDLWIAMAAEFQKLGSTVQSAQWTQKASEDDSASLRAC